MRHRAHSVLLILAGACLAMLDASAASPTAQAADATGQPIKVLFVAGGCCHDYLHQKDIITQGISARTAVQWTIAFDPDKSTGHKNPVYDNPDWARGFDVVVHDECTAGIKDLQVIDTILKPHRAGLPAVVLHCGMHCYRSEGFPKAVTPWFAFTGMPSTGHGPQAPIAVSYIDKESPIVHALENWTTINEELYNNSAGQPLDTAHALARGRQTVKGKDGREATNDYVVAWTNAYDGKTRVFGTTLGHNNATCADPRYLDLVARGLLWAVDKLDDAHLKPAQ